MYPSTVSAVQFISVSSHHVRCAAHRLADPPAGPGEGPAGVPSGQHVLQRDGPAEGAALALRVGPGATQHHSGGQHQPRPRDSPRG